MPRIIDHDKRRREIAHIVQELLLERGIESLTIRDVAERAGFSTTVVCHYFRSKRDMLIFTQAEARGRATTAISAGIAEGVDMLHCLERILPITYQLKLDWHTWFAFWGMAAEDVPLATERLNASSEANTLFEELVGCAQAAGRFDPDADRKDAATDIQLVVNGIATLATQDDAGWPAARQQQLLDRHLRRIGYRG